MKRERNKWSLLVIGLPVVLTLVALGCNSAQRSEDAGIMSRVSAQRTERSTAASDSPTIRWLLRDPKYNQYPGGPYGE